MIIASGAAANALIGSAAVGGTRCADRAHAAGSCAVAGDRGPPLGRRTADGPPDSLDRALELLSRTARTVPAGTFVFVLSDFLPPPSRDRLTDALAAGWDIVPVDRPGSRLGALVPGRVGCHASARGPRQTARCRSSGSAARRRVRDASSTSSALPTSTSRSASSSSTRSRSRAATGAPCTPRSWPGPKGDESRPRGYR